ncbi:MAG: dihydropteroate synthase [Candidatus Helarchaeota archaeon]
MAIDSIIAEIQVGDQAPVRIMGIINLSPESFYRGSIYTEIEEILGKAKQMISEGCDILDVGGRSTAPGVEQISIQTEKERVLPVIETLLDEVRIPISIDTQYADVAADALKLGVHIVNDVSGLKTDPKLAKVVHAYKSPLILMATKKDPGDCLSIDEIHHALTKSLKITTQTGIDPNKIIIDPGIGRWVPPKTYSYNLEIINRLEELREFGMPILVGISRKSMIGDILNKPDAEDRLLGTLAATAIAVYNGAHIIRTHDVGVTQDIIKIAKKFRMNAQ